MNFFRVFNAEQIDGIGPIPKVIPMEKNEMLKLAEEVIASSQCEIVESMQNRAYYSPKKIRSRCHQEIILRVRKRF